MAVRDDAQEFERSTFQKPDPPPKKRRKVDPDAIPEGFTVPEFPPEEPNEHERRWREQQGRDRETTNDNEETTAAAPVEIPDYTDKAKWIEVRTPEVVDHLDQRARLSGPHRTLRHLPPSSSSRGWGCALRGGSPRLPGFQLR